MTLPRPPAAIAIAIAALFAEVPVAPAPTLSPASLAPTLSAATSVPPVAVRDDLPPPAVTVAVTAADPVPAAPTRHVVQTASGDTLMGVLVGAGVDAEDARAAIDALAPVWNPRDLRIGQRLSFDVAAARLQALRVTPSPDRDVVVARGSDGQFASYAQPHPLRRVSALAGGVIRTTFFSAAADAGVPMALLSQMIHAFSYDVDFQREVHPGDRFEVVFDRLCDEGGQPVGAGDIAYAQMTLDGRALRLYRYKPAGETRADFFSARGQSVRKALLRTPIDGARLSSGFGMRLHPILGYTKMHRGVDFAAPTGTPIMAAGDGIVELAGVKGGYGNFLLLRHGRGLETAYAHMSRIAAHQGERVRQGEVIGYVGATGEATGPHLHYEVRIAGEPVNPLSIRMQPGRILRGKDLAAFRALVAAIDGKLPLLRGTPVVAAR